MKKVVVLSVVTRDEEGLILVTGTKNVPSIIPATTETAALLWVLQLAEFHHFPRIKLNVMPKYVLMLWLVEVKNALGQLLLSSKMLAL